MAMVPSPALSHTARQEAAMTHDMIPEIALNWHREGRGAALATVVETCLLYTSRCV